MFFAVTIGAEDNALSDLLFQPFQAGAVVRSADGKLLRLRVSVVEV